MVLKNSAPVELVTYLFTRCEKASGGSAFAMGMRVTSSVAHLLGLDALGGG